MQHCTKQNPHGEPGYCRRPPHEDGPCAWVPEMRASFETPVSGKMVFWTIVAWVLRKKLVHNDILISPKDE